jgi:hypothetical protein
MAKMAKAVGFGREAPAVQTPTPVRADSLAFTAPAAPAPQAAPSSDLWHENGERELELPERRLFGRRSRKYVGSHRPQEDRRVGRSERKRRTEGTRRSKPRPDYGFGS